MPAEPEVQALVRRYARRAPQPGRYSLLQPDVWHAVQERQRGLLRGLAARGWADLDQRQAVEVGCGSGGNLLELLRIGFAPQHLLGLELLPERQAQARAVLPQATPVWLGDAAAAPVTPGSQDLVLQFTVFSSLLDGEFQQQLAQAMWRWLKPGGAVLWYDLGRDNPRNPDVRGLPLARVRSLFPQGRLQAQRVTLAPPLARWLGRRAPALIPVCRLAPVLRTHWLVWVDKPAA